MYEARAEDNGNYNSIVFVYEHRLRTVCVFFFF